MKQLSGLRYLTFELNADCNLAAIHPRCPVNDPERFMFGQTDVTLSDQVTLDFWRWCRARGFDGIVLWHLYNEPTLVIARIRRLMTAMCVACPQQRFHLWTNAPNALKDGFDHVQLTDYRQVRPDDLDNRRASTRGEGRPYEEGASSGVCGRGHNWEVIVDFHANWLLCCNDWRAEESVGNLMKHDWELLLQNYEIKSKIAWRDRESYEALPRMCRSCIEVNPNLHRSALPPPGVTW